MEIEIDCHVDEADLARWRAKCNSPVIWCEGHEGLFSSGVPFGKCVNDHDICCMCYDTATQIPRGLYDPNDYVALLSSDKCNGCIKKIAKDKRDEMRKERDNEILELRNKIKDILEHKDVKRYIELIREMDADDFK